MSLSVIHSFIYLYMAQSSALSFSSFSSSISTLSPSSSRSSDTTLSRLSSFLLPSLPNRNSMLHRRRQSSLILLRCGAKDSSAGNFIIRDDDFYPWQSPITDGGDGGGDYLQVAGQGSRDRSFPHVEGNYALHVYIPVHVPPAARKELELFLKRVTSLVPGLNVVARKFHISLGRTVPIRVHQIDSIVTMLRQKLQSQRRYWIDFNKWEVFVNDDHTRSFLSMEVISGGLGEITRKIHAVDEIYRLHNLPEFYKDPHPHISLAWALGDVSQSLKQVFEELNSSHNSGNFPQKCIFPCKFSGIKCRIGNKTYKICKFPEE